MADSAVSGLTELTSIANNDELYIRDESVAAALESKRVLVSTMWASFGSFRDVSATVTASATQTQGQGQLTTALNVVTTVATAGDVCTGLASAAVGQIMCVVNKGANAMSLYPTSGEDLVAGTNTLVTVDVDDFYLGLKITSTLWLHISGTVSYA